MLDVIEICTQAAAIEEDNGRFAICLMAPGVFLLSETAAVDRREEIIVHDCPLMFYDQCIQMILDPVGRNVTGDRMNYLSFTFKKIQIKSDFFYISRDAKARGFLLV